MTTTHDLVALHEAAKAGFTSDYKNRDAAIESLRAVASGDLKTLAEWQRDNCDLCIRADAEKVDALVEAAARLLTAYRNGWAAAEWHNAHDDTAAALAALTNTVGADTKKEG
jgi:hypothetical protein